MFSLSSSQRSIGSYATALPTVPINTIEKPTRQESLILDQVYSEFEQVLKTLNEEQRRTCGHFGEFPRVHMKSGREKRREAERRAEEEILLSSSRD